MPKPESITDFHHLFLQDIPLLDVRAPTEFAKGAFPNSVNIPLLDDQQRHNIGIRYREQGQDAAVELGWQLATAQVRQCRQEVWLRFCRCHPSGYLYCFRGGLRSRLSQQLIAEAGVDYPVVAGGYKALRRYLIDEFNRACLCSPLILISGPTGSGKTHAIGCLHRALDLEGRANHRGSSFGAFLGAQPGQIDFENTLSIDWLKLRHEGSHPVFVEDEGHLIGKCSLPPLLQKSMAAAPLVVVDEPFESRVERILTEYVSDAFPVYQSLYGNAALERFNRVIQDSLLRIYKRLGGESYGQLAQTFTQAAQQLQNTYSVEGYRDGISLLLRQYYDPMYHYQFKKRQGDVLFRGDLDSIVAWANQLAPGMSVSG